jgi:hypothetical protein
MFARRTKRPRRRGLARRLRCPLTLVAAVTMTAAGAGTASAGTTPIPIDPGGGPCAHVTTGSVSVSAPSIALGQATAVHWSLHPAPGCAPTVVRVMYRDATTQTVIDTGLRGSTGSGSDTPQSSGSYFLEAFINGWFADFGSAPVTVELPVVNGRPTVEITQPRQNTLFAQAVGVPNAVVRIAGSVNLDLSWMTDVLVAPGVQIIGERTAFPRGPRLFTGSFPAHLLDIGQPDRPSDGVQITGIRFDGGESSDPCDSAGVEDADAILVVSSQSIEIDHNEFYRWRGSTVHVADPAGRINKDNAGTVWVHDNFFHDNQHPTYCGLNPFGSGHGGGYGVSVSGGAFALIERNVFDRNRHAIAGHGGPGDGYFAYRNLFLYPGVDDEKVSITNYNHQIDMHGSQTCGHGESFNCGPAGEYIEVAFNTVVSPASDAIQLRGTPSDPGGMSVYGNVFAQDRDSALTQTESGLHDNGGNIYDGAAYLLLTFANDAGDPGGTGCDFDRDGMTDAFRATGVTWWYFSSLLGHWVYLNFSSGGLAKSDTTLQDVNGDGRCDVTTSAGAFDTPSGAPFDLAQPADQVATVGHPASLQLSRSGSGALTWGATGLPPGLAIDAASGLISGTPDQAGTYTVTFGAGDARGATVNGVFRWTVTPDLRVVPDLDGDTLTAASQHLQAAGLVLGSAGTVRTDDKSLNGLVASQAFSPGTQIPAGSAVGVKLGHYQPLMCGPHPC